ncbi:unnamed protein product [Amoebophrya sp. A120]|nr:unnamed protein product [Amoebophrya sp. A120]|eukprot:GSA120T00018149001.1
MSSPESSPKRRSRKSPQQSPERVASIYEDANENQESWSSYLFTQGQHYLTGFRGLLEHGMAHNSDIRNFAVISPTDVGAIGANRIKNSPGGGKNSSSSSSRRPSEMKETSNQQLVPVDPSTSRTLTNKVKTTVLSFLDRAFEQWRSLTLQNRKSVLLAAFLLSMSIRQRKLATCCVGAYFFSAVPSSNSFESAFKSWFHEVYFPTIVFRFHEIYRKRLAEGVVAGTTTTANASGDPTNSATTERTAALKQMAASGLTQLKNLLQAQEKKLPTVTFVYEQVVKKYPNDFVDCALCKVACKEKSLFKIRFLGCLNRWSNMVLLPWEEVSSGKDNSRKSAPSVYDDEVLQQLAEDCILREQELAG